MAERTHPDDLLGADVVLLASGTWDVRGIEGQLNPHMWVSSTTRPHISTWPVSAVRVSRSGTIDISTRPERQMIWSTSSGRITAGRFLRHLGSSTSPTARKRS
jgi:hypothetical protein